MQLKDNLVRKTKHDSFSNITQWNMESNVVERGRTVFFKYFLSRKINDSYYLTIS